MVRRILITRPSNGVDWQHSGQGLTVMLIWLRIVHRAECCLQATIPLIRIKGMRRLLACSCAVPALFVVACTSIQSIPPADERTRMRLHRLAPSDDSDSNGELFPLPPARESSWKF
jgi:hypothetical protein